MFQILSLSGGGFLGLYSIALLAHIERQSETRIATHFDLLAGTSIGGIIALALAAEVPAEKIQSCFEQRGQKIFGTASAPESCLSGMSDFLCRFRRAKHSAAPLRDVIEAIVGPDLRLGDLRHPVIVPAVNLTKGSTQLFKTPHHKDFKVDWELKVADVAMATAAAPTYFPLAEIGNALYADGGLFANSPDLLAVHEATRFFDQRKVDLRVLSVGTTTARFSFAHPKTRRFGVLQWFKGARLLNVIIAAQQQSIDFMLKHDLGDRYLRLDAEQSKEQERVLGLDVATDRAQRTIKALADGTYQNSVNEPLLDLMLHHEAARPHFFYGRNAH